MIPEIGQIALLFGLALCFALMSLPVLGLYRSAFLGWSHQSRALTYTLFVMVLVSFIALAWSFWHNDFSVAYVAGHSNSHLPLYYRLSAIWGGHEGSLLLWLLILVGWMAAVARYSRSIPLDMVVWVLAVMALIAAGFFLFILLTSNPFDRLVPHFPLDGKDLNPLLQDFGLIVHPPMLYMGYVGLSVAFAFAIAGLIRGELSAQWAQWSRPWVLLAWVFLTLGIALGSWWAYYELGWGGWWFWDPVENASFMPWLTATALLHSLVVAEKRGAFKAWTVLLALLAFSLSLLGTFLVRSGVLTSVHAFANDPERGLFILIFLCVVIGGSLTLFAWRAQKLQSHSNYQRLSREMLLLTNNVILMVATLVVLLGTLFPLISDAMGIGKLSVGPPYFDTLFVPLTWLLLCVLGLGPLVHWQQYSAERLWHRVRWMLPIAVVFGLAMPWLQWQTLDWPVVLSVGLSVWVLALLLKELKDVVVKGGRVDGGRLRQRPLRYWGMFSAHLGVLVVVVGVAYTQFYSIEKDVRLAVGESAELVGKGGWVLRFEFTDVIVVDGPNYTAHRGQFEVYQNDQWVARLMPEKRNYWVARNVMTEAAIDPGLNRDIYVAMGEPLDEGAQAWAVRLYVKPFVRWVWLGAIFMAVGGVLAMSGSKKTRSRA